MGNLYIPKVIRIEHVSEDAPNTKTISLKYPLDFIPGQFLEVSCFGIGEAPISISSAPHEELLKISFKRVGSVTEGLFDLKKNDTLGIRGPFGRGFPLEQIEGKNLIFIAGGMGLAPLRSLLKFIFSRKNKPSGNIILLCGSRTPQDMLYKKDLEDWSEHIKVLLTVDSADTSWRGRVGVVTELLNEITIDPLTTKALICGPSIMMRFAAARLLELGMNPMDILLSLERCMKCGMGKCGHCYISNKFVCLDGPVFTIRELDDLVPMEMLR